MPRALLALLFFGYNFSNGPGHSLINKTKYRNIPNEINRHNNIILQSEFTDRAPCNTKSQSRFALSYRSDAEAARHSWKSSFRRRKIYFFWETKTKLCIRHGDVGLYYITNESSLRGNDALLWNNLRIIWRGKMNFKLFHGVSWKGQHSVCI